MKLESGGVMGKHVCSCKKIAKAELKEIIIDNDIKKFKELSKFTKAGKNGCCKKDIKKLIEKYS